MSRGGLRPRLIHIQEAVLAIERYTRGRSLRDYRADPMLRDAVERNIERLSEASRHIPAALKAAHAEVPWQQVAGIGNVLRDDYDGVDDKVMWEAATKGLPRLKAAVEAMIRAVEDG